MRRRRVNPSVDHSQLSTTRPGAGLPSQPMAIGDSSVRRSIAASRPAAGSPTRGIAVPIVRVVLAVEGEEDRVQAGIVSASSSAARTRQVAEARSNWDREAERTIREPCSLCHRFAQSGHVPEPTVGGGADSTPPISAAAEDPSRASCSGLTSEHPSPEIDRQRVPA